MRIVCAFLVILSVSLLSGCANRGEREPRFARSVPERNLPQDEVHNPRILVHRQSGDEKDELVREKLRTTIISEINFDGVKAEAAFKAVEELTGLDIYVDCPPTGRDKDLLAIPVTLHLRRVSASTVLDLLCGSLMCQRLDHGVRNGVVIISEESSLWFTTRVYDCSELIGPSMSAPQQAVLVEALNTWSRAERRQIKHSREPIHGERRERIADLVRLQDRTRDDMLKELRWEAGQEKMEGLMTLIEGTVDPLSWEYSGGSGVVDYRESALVIRNTPRIHDQIEWLLNTLLRHKTILQMQGSLGPTRSWGEPQPCFP